MDLTNWMDSIFGKDFGLYPTIGILFMVAVLTGSILGSI